MKIENSLSAPQHPDAPSQAGLHFTVATEEDFDEIMAMSQHIYGGLDYLPTRYGAWMQEANRTVVLARKQGKVIALESVCVIDGGETMLVEGLRVASAERGRGVAGELLRFCSQLTKAKHPEVKVSRLTRDDQLGPKDFQKYRLVAKPQGILLVRFRAEDLKLRLAQLGPDGAELSSASSSSSTAAAAAAAGGPPPPAPPLAPPPPPPVLLDAAAVQRLYLDSDLLRHVLPSGTVVQDWQPYKLLPGNMDVLLKKDIDWAVDDQEAPRVASLCTFPIRVPIGDDWYYLNIDMFGKDLSLVRRQYLAHLRRHTASLRGSVMCQLFLEPSLWSPMAELCRSVLRVELVKEYTEQCVVESDVV